MAVSSDERSHATPQLPYHQDDKHEIARCGGFSAFTRKSVTHATRQSVAADVP